MIQITLTTQEERKRIYELRYRFFARHLNFSNNEELLSDKFDNFNEYIIAKSSDEIIGLISIIPYTKAGFSLEKYVSIKNLPFSPDQSTFEMKGLGVVERYAKSSIPFALIWAAYRYIQGQNEKTIIGLVNLDMLPVYEAIGLKKQSPPIAVGRRTCHLIIGETKSLDENLVNNPSHRWFKMIQRIKQSIGWNLAIPFFESKKDNKSLIKPKTDNQGIADQAHL